MIRTIISLCIIATTAGFAGASQQRGIVFDKSAYVSYYADKFHGRKTASGEMFDQRKPTCAHRTLDFGTRVAFYNPVNKRTMVLKVNDRGPFHPDRLFDLPKGYFVYISHAGTTPGTLKLQYKVLGK